MRIATKSLPLLAAASALVLAGCDYPTDQSAGMYVALSAPAPVLLRGSVTDLTATVWLRGESGDSTEVRNAELIWSTSDPVLATIAAGGPAVGRVTGVNSGTVQVRAVARGYESATPGVFDLRVANPLEIDSLTPDTVRYGDLLVVHGVGVGSLLFAGLGTGTLGIDSLAVSGDPQGLGAAAFWVTYPSSSGQFFAAGSGQLVTSPDTTVVLPWDRYEPNELTPWILALDGAPPYPAAPFIRFINPALAFEDLRGAAFGYDWYRWTTADPSKAYTFVFIGPALGRTHGTYLTDDAGTTTPNSWRIGPGQYDCKGFQFRPPVTPADSLIIALGRLPAGSVDLISAYTQQGRYALGVLEGYHVADARVPADRFEENDLCLFADANFADPSKQIVLSAEFAENLTIDTPNEIDWLRFRVPGATPQPVTVRTMSHIFGKPIDRTDIDAYILRVPIDARGLQMMGNDAASGSSSTVSALLEPGDYYLAVVDSAGFPTHYGVCIAIGATCTLPASPPPPAVAPARPFPRLPIPAGAPPALPSRSTPTTRSWR